MRNPDAAPLAHQRVERDRHAAGRRRDANFPMAVVAVEIWFAVRDDDQRPLGVRVELAGAGEPHPEQRWTEQLVDCDERNQQRLHAPAPVGELGGEHGREPERDAGLRDQSGPDRDAQAAVESGGIGAGNHAELDDQEP